MRRSMIHLMALLVALLLFTTVVGAQDPPLQHGTQNPGLAQGTGEDSVYRQSEIDTVNLFNGNLTLSVPLGQSYQVGGNLSYGLSLIYNSGGGWEVEDPNNATCYVPPPVDEDVSFTIAKPSLLTNAGLGWNISLGRLVPTSLHPTTQLRFSRWTYLDPSGHRRGFYDRLHAGGVGTATDVFYTNDGSYMRLKLDVAGCRTVPGTGSTCHVVEFSDGIYHEFRQVLGGDDVGFRPTYMADRFGNWVEIHYLNGDWKIQDMHGRIQEVDFETDPRGRPRVHQVRLTAFADTPGGNGEAVYDFEYEDDDIAWHQLSHASSTIGCHIPMFKSPMEAIPETTPVGLLKTLTLPDQSFFGMEYFDAEITVDGTLGGRSGGIESLRLASGVVYHWRYSDSWGLERFNRGPFGVLLPSSRVLGIYSKERIEDGETTGLWTYDHAFSPVPSHLDRGFSSHVPCYHQTEVKVFSDSAGDPPLLWDRYYFASARNLWDDFVGMGFTPCVPGDTSGNFFDGPNLSHQALDSVGNVLRETYVVYDTEGTPGHGSGSERNFRLRERIVEYHDDIDASTGQPLSTRETWGYDAANQADDPLDYDGLGHFRTYRFDSTFPGRNRKEVYTRYGVRDGQLTDLGYAPAVDDPWVLNTYEDVRTTEGEPSDNHVARTLFCFDPDTGFLQGHRLMRSNQEGAGDIVVRFEESQGNVTRERYYGGNTAVGAERCEVSAAATYDIRHDYDVGVRKLTEYFDGDQVIHRPLNLEIDSNTGLVATRTDASGIATEYLYDAMGRVLQERPAHTAWRIHTYGFPTTNQSNRNLEHDIRDCANGTQNCSGDNALRERRLDFDRRGQLTQEVRRMPAIAGGGTRLVERQFSYDTLGRPTSQGEWRDPNLSGFEFSTLMRDYDRFGRAGEVVAPDGTITSFQFTGDRITHRSVEVAGSNGPLTASVEEHRDGKGRLILVREQSGAPDTWVDTTYEYDEGNRLIKVCVNDGNHDATDTCNGQQRKFDYDDRGLLTQEEHPELGRSNNTDRWIRYTSHDAKGNMLVRSLAGDGLDRNYVYDKAGRAVQVKRPASFGGDTDRMLQEFFYQRPTPGACGSTLRQTKQHNRVPLPGSGETEHDVVVTETFDFDPNDACRLATYGVRASHADGFRALRFQTAFSYNDLSNVTGIGYPDCGSSPGCAPGPSQVDFMHRHGLLETVGDTAHITYHPTGQVHTIDHVGSGLDTYERSSTVWKPLSRITVTGLPNNAAWTYGPFHYDGAQNVHRIETSMGDETYTYDQVGRLTTSAVRSDIGLKTQDLSYDVFGNLSQIETDEGTIDIDLGDQQRNRLGAAHGADYDVAGSVTSLRLGAVDYTYYRDALDRMRRLRGAGVDHSFLYTVDGERLAILDLLSQSSEWTLRDDNNQLLSRFERDGGLDVAWQKDYMHGAGMQLAAAIADGSGGETLRHFHLDHAGTTRRITGDGGQTLTRNTFYPFGGYTQPPISGTEELQFTGHERDDLGGNTDGHLDYMHARYYTPRLGRFLAVDPGRDQHATRPQSWNLYSYVRNNPLRASDPTGMFVQALAAFAGTVEKAYLEEKEQQLAMEAAYLQEIASIDTSGRVEEVPGPQEMLMGGFAVNFSRKVMGTAGQGVLKAADDVVVKTCFPAGTTVWTDDGHVPIENIEPGQRVACADPESTTWTFCNVEERLEYPFQGQLISVVVADEVLHATDTHPFWVAQGQELDRRPPAADAGPDAWIRSAEGRWVEAQDLEAGDVLLGATGERETVLAVGAVTASLPVFNLRVADLHTYAVGSHGLLVHNRSWGIRPPKKFTSKMGSQADIIDEGNDIRKIDTLVRLFGGRAKYWKKMKTWDEYGREIHYYQHKSVGRVGVKWDGEPDPF